ncbi:MAG: type II toxin-antitoxin system RelE/ParE family toxin [bacterium]|nr:type II toxin-antitoxin system RelE/ParE family toxin [bacterium]
MTYQVILSPVALKMLHGITDRRVQQQIRDRITKLAEDPAKQGKPLVQELAGYRSLRAAGEKYRIIYQVEKNIVRVFVVAVGIRREGDKKDIYALAQRLVRLGLLDPSR